MVALQGLILFVVLGVGAGVLVLWREVRRRGATVDGLVEGLVAVIPRRKPAWLCPRSCCVRRDRRAVAKAALPERVGQSERWTIVPQEPPEW